MDFIGKEGPGEQWAGGSASFCSGHPKLSDLLTGRPPCPTIVLSPLGLATIQCPGNTSASGMPQMDWLGEEQGAHGGRGAGRGWRTM
jgi:hypothetical protein